MRPLTDYQPDLQRSHRQCLRRVAQRHVGLEQRHWGPMLQVMRRHTECRQDSQVLSHQQGWQPWCIQRPATPCLTAAQRPPQRHHHMRPPQDCRPLCTPFPTTQQLKPLQFLPPPQPFIRPFMASVVPLSRGQRRGMLFRPVTSPWGGMRSRHIRPSRCLRCTSRRRDLLLACEPSF